MIMLLHCKWATTAKIRQVRRMRDIYALIKNSGLVGEYVDFGFHYFSRGALEAKLRSPIAHPFFGLASNILQCEGYTLYESHSKHSALCALGCPLIVSSSYSKFVS